MTSKVYPRTVRINLLSANDAYVYITFNLHNAEIFVYKPCIDHGDQILTSEGDP